MIDGYFDILVASLLACAAFFAYRYKTKNDFISNSQSTKPNTPVNIIYGPKGWISLFQIILILNATMGTAVQLGLLYSLKNKIEDISKLSSWQAYMNFNHVFALFNFVLSIYIFYRLQKVFLKSTINFIYFFVFGLILFECINLVLFFNSDFFRYYLYKTSVSDAIAKMVFAFLIFKLPWLIYFKRSMRVRNTYI